MGCERIEQLLPLHAGGDLDDEQGLIVAEHLRSCEWCADVARGYEDSLDLLRSHSDPQVDVAFYESIRRSVLVAIEDGRAQDETAIGGAQLPAARPFPGALPLAWRALAIAAALAIVALAGLWMLRGRHETRQAIVPPTPGGEARIVAPPVTAPDVVKVPGPQPPTKPRTDPMTRVKHVRKIRARRAAAVAAVDRTPEKPAVMRIEYQTADPNIRVIWFAPVKESNHSQRNAAHGA